MTLADIIKNDFPSLAEELGDNTFTYRGEDYSCVASSISLAEKLEIGGIGIDADLSITVLKSDFTDGFYPESKEEITYKGRQYKINIVRQDTTGAMIRLLCEDWNK